MSLHAYCSRILKRSLLHVGHSSNPRIIFVSALSSSAILRQNSNVDEPMASHSISTPKPKKVPVTPRPSASVAVINDQNEILFVQRNPKTTFGGVYVFPGGNFDAKQDDSFEMTAIRETFEESGLLLASADASRQGVSSPNDAELDKARNAIHSQKVSFQRFLSDQGLSADVPSLLPFTQWITPFFAPRRFHARFYVAFLPSASSSGFASGNRQDRIPTPDGGQEVLSARFIHPSEALASFRAGEITFMPPQYYLLSTLADILQGRTNTREQRETVARLARGAFGKMVINPVPLKEKGENGTSVLTYEGDETRGGPKGRMHRSLIKTAPDGVVTTEITLLRNFDIFTDIDENLFTPSAKL